MGGLTTLVRVKCRGSSSDDILVGGPLGMIVSALQNVIMTFNPYRNHF